MGSSLRTRETLLYGEGENRTFQEIIEAGSTLGWHSFDQSLMRAFEEDLISEETALLFCTHKNKMRRDLEMAKKLRATIARRAIGFKNRFALKLMKTGNDDQFRQELRLAQLEIKMLREQLLKSVQDAQRVAGRDARNQPRRELAAPPAKSVIVPMLP